MNPETTQQVTKKQTIKNVPDVTPTINDETGGTVYNNLTNYSIRGRVANEIDAQKGQYKDLSIDHLYLSENATSKPAILDQEGDTDYLTLFTKHLTQNLEYSGNSQNGFETLAKILEAVRPYGEDYTTLNPVFTEMNESILQLLKDLTTIQGADIVDDDIIPAGEITGGGRNMRQMTSKNHKRRKTRRWKK